MNNSSLRQGGANSSKQEAVPEVEQGSGNTSRKLGEASQPVKKKMKYIDDQIHHNKTILQ